MTKIYVGSGGHGDEDSIHMVEQVAESLAQIGWHLRTGGNKGLDTGFAHGCDRGHGTKEIYVPSFKFNGLTGENIQVVHTLNKHLDAMAEVINFWPNFYKESTDTQMFLTRYVFMLFGTKLDKPADVVIVWNEHDKTGTRMLMTMAEALEIPCFNIRNEEDQIKLEEFIEAN